MLQEMHDCVRRHSVEKIEQMSMSVLGIHYRNCTEKFCAVGRYRNFSSQENA